MVMHMKVAIIILAATIAILILALWLFTEKIPANVMTRNRISMTEYRIHEYAATHHRLPSSLSDLPPLEKNRDSSVADGWGRPIQYTAKDMTVTLLSLGKDGQPGGTGEDADIQVTFTVRDAASEAATQP